MVNRTRKQRVVPPEGGLTSRPNRSTPHLPHRHLEGQEGQPCRKIAAAGRGGAAPLDFLHHRPLEVAPMEQVSVHVRLDVARALQAGEAETPASKEILEDASRLGVSLEPVHPGTSAPDLLTHFTVYVE